MNSGVAGTRRPAGVVGVNANVSGADRGTCLGDGNAGALRLRAEDAERDPEDEGSFEEDGSAITGPAEGAKTLGDMAVPNGVLKDVAPKRRDDGRDRPRGEYEYMFDDRVPKL